MSDLNSAVEAVNNAKQFRLDYCGGLKCYMLVPTSHQSRLEVTERITTADYV